MTFVKFLSAAVVVAVIAACVPQKRPLPPPQKVPSINTTIKTSARSDRIRLYSTPGASQKRGRVRVCIRNSASGRDKGLHFQSSRAPKYVVKRRNQSSCGHYKPGKKVFYLWRRTALGKWKLRRTLRLNLTKFAGQQITFDWVQD